MKLSFRVFFILLVSLTLIGCNTAGSNSGIMAYKVSDLMDASTNRADSFSGLVVAQQSKEIMKDETKVIKEIYVKEGDPVTAETVLFSYDTEAMALEVDKADIEIERMNNSITANHNEIQSLINERAQVSASQQFQYTLEIQTLEAEIRETEYNIRSKQVERDLLAASVENADVKSEIDGIVQTINDSNQGDFMGNSSNAFMTILQTGNYRVKGHINEMNISQLVVGSPVSIVSRIDSSQVYTGIVESVEMNNPEQSDDYYGMPTNEMVNSSNYPFYVMMDSTDGLFLGQHVYVIPGDVEETPKEGAWIFSHYFVYDDSGSIKVWKVDESKRLQLVEVILGDMDPMTDQYQVLEGLTADDYIVEPFENLEEGTSVTLVEGE